jgi:hypothetical protein
MDLVKRCFDCGREKVVSEFNRHAGKADGLQPRCRECQRTDSKNYYDANRTRMRQQIIAARARRRALLQQFVIEYLTEHPCVDCGEADLIVLDFDHVRGVKEHNISDLIAQEKPLATLQAEITKCDVRCANCHRRRTFRERGSYRLIQAPLAQVGSAPDS